MEYDLKGWTKRTAPLALVAVSSLYLGGVTARVMHHARVDQSLFYEQRWRDVMLWPLGKLTLNGKVDTAERQQSKHEEWIMAVEARRKEYYKLYPEELEHPSTKQRDPAEYEGKIIRNIGIPDPQEPPKRVPRGTRVKPEAQD